MPIFLAIVGGLQIAFALLVLFTAKTAFHETTAAISFGFGCACFGLKRICELLQIIDARAEKVEADRNQREYAEREARANELAKSYKVKALP